MNSLPIRLSADQANHDTNKQEDPSPTSPKGSKGSGTPADTIVARTGGNGGLVTADNHQFWLHDIKILESLYTVNDSAKHLFEFTGQLLGINHPDGAPGQKPIPILSDSDVALMTQRANDIAQGVGGIAAVRHHSMRARKRKNDNGFTRDVTRQWIAEHAGSSKSKRQKIPKEKTCQDCGRTDTPEWRKGPEGPGTLCNVCGLLYAKRKRRIKSETPG